MITRYGTNAFALCAALLAAGTATAQVPRPAASITPKIVVQGVAMGGFDVAAWSADNRFVFTASGMLRELLVWDIAAGVIVDRVRLPSGLGALSEFMKLDAMVLQPDGRTLHIDGVVLDPASPDLRGPRRYEVDINTRQVRIITARALAPLQPGDDWSQMMQRWVQALSAAHGQGTDMTRPDAERLLPALPRSPDSNSTLLRRGMAFVVRDAAGKERGMQAGARALGGIDDADLSPDDRRLAMLSLAGDDVPGIETTSKIEFFDIADGRFLAPFQLAGEYNFIHWISPGRLFVLAQDSYDDPLDDTPGGAPDGLPPPVVLYDADAGREVSQMPSRCFMTPLPDGSLLGAGLANCRKQAGNDRGLARLVDGAWRPLPGVALKSGDHVRMLAASPRGDRVAALIRQKSGEKSLVIADAGTGAVVHTLSLLASVEPTRIGFAPDGNRLWLAANGTMLEWDPARPPTAAGLPATRDLPVRAAMPTSFAVQGTRLLVSGSFEERIEVVDLATGGALPPIAFPGATSIGFMRTRPVLWAASSNDGVRLWNARTGEELMTIALLPDQRYVVVAGDGRYDTNLGPDSESFRWFMPDQPFRSLAPQTLMRDYYEPRLIAKLMDCTQAGNCARVLHPVPPVAGLNRQLPTVRITEVKPIRPGWAQVNIEVNETSDAGSGRKSGVYGVKLLMNNREVSRDPDDSSAKPSTLNEWRQANLSPPGDDQGNRYWGLEVQLPTDGKPLQFSAYSFNSDRVKSDTARLAWTPPQGPLAMPPRVRRAFVLTIGVNDYSESRLALNFAVPDAQLISQRLASIPGYEMRHASLTTARLQGGSVRSVTREDIDKALGILAGFPPGPYQTELKAAGFDASALDNATPDDIVIISFSGHGFADTSGNFALVPSNARWPVTDAGPQADTVIDAAQLTMWLRAIKAQEIAFIIDACHSGAAVNTPDFKPGPMGDPGLGQLAFDKGLRILAATQADDVALENASLAQGFLTAALGEGLTPTGGPADLNRDGKVLLDEWLRYAVARLPSLNEEVRRGGGAMAARGVRLVMRAPSAAPPKSQEPSLFDFNSAPSPVALRGQP